jgi:hypothetical protein
VAKGTGARRSGSRQQSPPAPPSPPRNQGIRLWLAALAVAFAQLAMGESGLHGQTLFGALIASTIATALVAAFFNHLTNWFPRLDLARRLRAVAQPKAFFFLFCLAVVASWLLDYTARISVATTPAGSYQAPQAQAQKFPLIPSHARLHFGTGSNRAQPYGKQENVHAWNSINTGSSQGPTGQMVVFERTFITVVRNRQKFLNCTSIKSAVVIVPFLSMT